MIRQVTLKHGIQVPCLGQGTWHIGEDASQIENEVQAMQWGIEHDMTLIDTAEMYGDGKAEILVGKAIQPYARDRLFLVSKVYPWNADRLHIFTACENSLKRMQTSYLDLYLLHWRGEVPLAETVLCMEKLVSSGLIRSWGVSNFDVLDMMELLQIEQGVNCIADQVMYHLGSRGAEQNLLPWLKEHAMNMMIYSPLAQAGRLRTTLLNNPALQAIAERRKISVFQVLLAFAMRDPSTFTVAKAGSKMHIQANRKAADILLTENELEVLNQQFPCHLHAHGLDMV